MESSEGLRVEEECRPGSESCTPESPCSPRSATHLSSSTSAVSLGEVIANHARQAIGSWYPLPGVEDTGLLTEASISNMAQASPWPARNRAHQGSPSFLAGPITVAGDSSLLQPGGASCSFQLGTEEFQDSHLSPALPLLPANYGKVHSLLEDTVFHHTALEFVALRGSPDISAASETERLSIALQGDIGMCELPSLSLSELSQGRLDTDHASLSVHTGPLTLASGEDASSSHSLSQHTLSPVSGDGDGMADCVPIILQKDLVPDGSQSGTESQHSNSDGGSPDSGAQENLQQEIPTEENNSNGLHKQLCHENNGIQSESEPEENQSHPPRNSQSVTYNFELMESSTGRESITTEVPYGINKAASRWSAGFSFERGHSEKELSSSGNHTTVEGSFVGSLAQPVYQSTPFIFPGILQAAVQPSLGKLSAVESSVVVSLASANEARNVPSKPTQTHAFDNSSTVLSPSPLSFQRSGKIQSLPSLSYMEKVGAWNVNQASGKTYSDLALHSPRRNLAVSFSGTSASARDSLSFPRSGGSHSSPLAGCFGTTGKEAQPTRALQSLPKTYSGSGAGCLSPSLARNLATSDSDLLLETTVGQTPQIEQRQSEPASECTRIPVNQSVLQECKANVTQGGTAESGDLLEIQKKVEHLPEVDLHHFSNVSSNQALQGVLTSSQDSYQGKQKLAASPSAVSSVPSLEVDTYTHWMTDPSTPVKDKEMNIDERIPMYLRNLGIDQSPSTILTRFVSRGPIREPEFSPTDLCTIKDSTPTKSTLPSEGNTPEKGEFSKSSVLSLGSSESIPLSLDSFQPDAPSHIPQKDRCLSQCSLQAAIHPLGASLDPLPQQPLENDTLCEGQHPVPGISQQASSEGSKIIEHAQEGRFQSRKAETQNTQDRVSSTDPLPVLSVTDSSVGYRTLQELLSKTQSTVSERPSLSSSSATMWGSENSLLCVQNKLGSFAGSLASSWNRDTASLLGGKSSLDSLLIADGQRETSSKEPFRSSKPSTDQLTATKHAAPLRTGVDAGPSSVVAISAQPAGFLSDKSVRREPEGCSAVVPDQALPVSVPAEGCPEADSLQSQEVVSLSKASSSASVEMRPASGSREADRNAESDSGSADVLAAKVASLLRNESPATVASSGASFADEEERRAREWIRLKVLGQQCEPLGLNIQDRQRIEEIKRELLLCTRRQTKSQLSSETDSSTQSSRDGLGAEPRAQAECFMALKTTEHRLSDQVQRLSRMPSHSGVRFDSGRRRDLEARVSEITHRDALTLSGAGTPSINLTSHHQFPFSSTITPAPAPQPHNSGLSSETREPAVVQNFGFMTQDSLDTEQDPQAGCIPPIRATPGHSSTKDTGAMENNETGSSSDLEVHSNLLTTGTQDSFYAGLLLASEKKNVSWISTRDTEQRKHPSDSVSPLAAVSQLPEFSTGTSFGMNCTSSRQMSKSLPDVRRSLTNLKPCVVPLHIVPLASSSLSISSSTKNVPSDLPLTLTPKQPSGNTSEFKLVTHSQEGGSTSVKELPADQPSGSSSQIAYDMNMDFMKHSDLHSDSQPSAEQSSYFPATGMVSITFGPQKGQQSVRRQDPETADASVQITTCFPREESRSTRPTLPQSSSLPQEMMSGPLSIQTPAVPVLLPYKPHGSPELFYMPQAGVALSHVHSGTTLDSHHPGWDASPPKPHMEVLGSSEQEVNDTITITGVEGTYSMQWQGSDVHQGAAIQGLHLNENGGSYCSQQLDSLSLERNTHASPSAYNSPSNPQGRKRWLPNRDPSVGHMVFKQSQEQDECALLLGEVDHADNPEPFHRTGREGFATARCSLVSGKQGSSSLDELRQRFRQGWSLRGTCSSRETEKSLLERLERLSRLIHSTGLELERANQLHGIREGQQSVGLRGRGETAGQERRAAMEPVRREWASRRGREETKKSKGTETEGDNVRRTQTGQGVRKGADKGESSRMSGNGQQPVRLAWGGHGSLRSTDTTPASRHRCPAERDASGHTSGETDVSVQTESGDTTASTIDTARLVRAFGPQRVNSGLERLHSAIDRQRDGREQRRGKKGSSRYAGHALGQTHSTNESAASPKSILSSSSSYAHPPQPDPTQDQRTVKHLSKGIQAGNLEIVSNSARKHTRDVGTNFPSPRLARANEVISEGAVLITKGGKGEHRTPPKHQTIANERRGRRSQQMHYPRGVSWFVPADDLKARSKKENRPDSTGPALASGLAWFEAYTKTKPWREPLRERQVQEEPMGSRPKTLGEPITSTNTSKVPCGLIRITLQEALEMRRPDFISRSQERMKRLGLQVEERRLQAIFAQERENLFSQPVNVQTHPQPTGLRGLNAYKGPPACARRAVPKKEMFMRSKQMYSQLPEVRRRKEEERRKAEYHSYRLKAQLYKTKITNRILGRRTPWQ